MTSSGKFSRYKILVVDDDDSQRSLLESFLTRQGFTIVTASSGERAIEALGRDEGIHMMISDVRMPGLSGFETLRNARQTRKTLPILLVTAYADIRDAVKAMQDGAVNYLEKPIDLDELLRSIKLAIGIDEPIRMVYPDQLTLPDWVVVESASMREVFHEAALVAASDSRILITGESGVGKEILGDVIHQWSKRASKPFIKVNCAAIPEQLLESELFGHEKGAFTGATHQRIGRFEEAHEGTILLDEIAEMSAALQAKLLRITQDGTYQRVGSNQVRRSNARILASTNKHLEREVELGHFREDLYFRLNVVEIFIPPLRERKEDILPLAHHFASQFMDSNPRLSASVIECLSEYDWPGNVRELRNAMERACLMARGDVIIPEHLPKRIFSVYQSSIKNNMERTPKLEDIEREAILKALQRNRHNRTETAKELGISRRALTYKIQRYIQQGYVIE